MMLRKFLEVNHLKQVDLVRYLDQSASFVSQIVKGTRPIPEDSLNKLLNNKHGWDVSMLNPDNGQSRRQPAPGVKLIPLLPFSAAAGYLAGGNDADAFREESIAFPDFTARGADCAIRVDGDSMYPRYKSGDILAIKILRDPTFFQWGRVYCLSTTQGCIVKKLFPYPGDNRKIVCHSENWEHFPDYTITMDDVLAVAIVVGHAGIE